MLSKFDLENQFCAHFHYHVRMQRAKIMGIVSFKLIEGTLFSELYPGILSYTLLQVIYPHFQLQKRRL